MADITYQSILNLEESIEQFEPKPYMNKPGMFDIIQGIIYLLSLNHIMITWRDLDKKLKAVVTKNLENPIYNIFAGAFSGGSPDTASSWETFFTWTPGMCGLNLGQNERPQEVLPFLKSLDWPKYKKLIEEHALPRLRLHPTATKNVCIITNDLAKTI